MDACSSVAGFENDVLPLTTFTSWTLRKACHIIFASLGVDLPSSGPPKRCVHMTKLRAISVHQSSNSICSSTCIALALLSASIAAVAVTPGGVSPLCAELLPIIPSSAACPSVLAEPHAGDRFSAGSRHAGGLCELIPPTPIHWLALPFSSAVRSGPLSLLVSKKLTVAPFLAVFAHIAASHTS